MKIGINGACVLCLNIPGSTSYAELSIAGINPICLECCQEWYKHRYIKSGKMDVKG